MNKKINIDKKVYIRIIALIAILVAIALIFIIWGAKIFDYKHLLVFELNEDCDSYSVTRLSRTTVFNAIFYSVGQSFGFERTLTIPSTYKNLPVTNISAGAFSDQSSDLRDKKWYLDRVVIPNSIINIEDGAFSGQSALVSVDFAPDSQLKFIGDRAFSGCKDLTNITIPNSIYSIGEGVFSRCTSLTSINVNPITDIDTKNQYYKSIDGNLYFCRKNENSYTVKVTLIQYAIGKKDSTFTIPNDVNQIEKGAFSGCTSLTSVIFTGPNGWKVKNKPEDNGGQNIPYTDLEDPATAAEYLTKTYADKYWYNN